MPKSRLPSRAAGAVRRNGRSKPPSSEPSLVLIGGHEAKEGEMLILKEVARRVGTGKLVVTTVASNEPDGLFESYEPIFGGLGVRHVEKLEVQSREEARRPEAVAKLEGAAGIFLPVAISFASQASSATLLSTSRCVNSIAAV